MKLKYWFTILAIAVPLTIFSHAKRPGVFSVDSVIDVVAKQTSFDSITTIRTSPQQWPSNSDDGLQFAADSLRWFGVSGRYIVTMNEERAIQRFIWESYRRSPLVYDSLIKAFDKRYGKHQTQSDGKLTYLQKKAVVALYQNPNKTIAIVVEPGKK